MNHKRKEEMTIMSKKQKRIGNGNKTISKINPKTLKRLLS